METLNGITSEQASIRVGGKCGSLAAQVAHVTFYIETTEKAMLTGEDEAADYQKIWRTVEKVNDEEWRQLKENLKAAYERIHSLLGGPEAWDFGRMGGAFTILVHSAYHLGEIRQALCTLK